MSIRVMTLIWDTCLYQAGTLNALLAMADHASDNGRDIYPGMEFLAAKCRQTVRATQACVKQLRKDKVVILLDRDGNDLEPNANPTGGRGWKTQYRIDLQRVKILQGLHQDENPDCEHCKAGRKTPQSDAEKGEDHGKKGELSRSHIERTVNEPSLNLSRAAGAAQSANIASLGEGSPERWPEFRNAIAETWPDGFPADNEVACKSEFIRQTRQYAADTVIACGRLHGAELRRRQETRGKRAGKVIAKKPSNWLKEGDWQGYIPQVEADAVQGARTVTALGSVQRSLGAELFNRLREWGMPDISLAALDGIIFQAPAQFLIVSGVQRILLEKHERRLESALGERPSYVMIRKAAG
jgi:hypothetical protein